MTYVALMRGINVGGKNKLPMKDLAAIFTGLGCRNVRTYIQSGNVVFDAPASVARKLASQIAANISKQFGLTVPVVLRDREEMARVITGNPFLAAGLDEKWLHVMFLADRPTANAVAELDHNRSAPDEFQVVGREIYLHLPNGAGNSKLTNVYFDSKLGTISTARNWATTLALFEMIKG
ncbi:MAG TPA: DUF1697 domain-containing protein [candidate division Zixibacteria bacterium]|nr:DUF1697 domain-containing protein [candidate division Zixibacteria bacterium]